MKNRGSGIPSAIAEALERLKDGLAREAGPNFAGLVLYGGLARGLYREGKSDVNVLVLLNDASAASLAKVTPTLKAAARAARVDPMLLTTAELARTAAAFPTKFLDIKNHHVVLAGEDPLAAIAVTREEVRLRTLQALQNLLLRLRHSYVTAEGDETLLLRTLTQMARPLALELEALLYLTGHEVPTEDRSAAVFAAAAKAFSFEAEPLARLAKLRHGERPLNEVATLYADVLVCVTLACEFAEKAQELSG